ncbi:MAG: hypothetical protein LBT84_01490 [Spirochaetia bacterium]|jgi:hypothetical protein|nr:hypothetical protein [Spirochaetia bacterium]
MRAINIANAKKRNAEVGFEALPKKKTVKMVMPDGTEKTNVRFLKSMANLEELKQKFNGDLTAVGNAIIEGDPEIDMELVGRFISKTHKLYITPEHKIAYRVNLFEVIYNPDGSEKERHELSKSISNVNAEVPVQWSGKKFPKAEALKKFIFSKKYQIRHISGLTYDFLYDMAKELHESGTLMFVGAGPKGNEPIVITGDGERYRGFLEGRIDGDKYCLILHLTNIEIKPLEEAGPQQGE